MSPPRYRYGAVNSRLNHPMAASMTQGGRRA
jgi:hypothetical protein